MYPFIGGDEPLHKQSLGESIGNVDSRPEKLAHVQCSKCCYGEEEFKTACRARISVLAKLVRVSSARSLP